LLAVPAKESRREKRTNARRAHYARSLPAERIKEAFERMHQGEVIQNVIRISTERHP